MPSSLELINLEFIGNLLLSQQQANFFQLMTVYSDFNTNIQIENIFFKQNVFHQQTDDLQDSSAALIHIVSNKGYITINNIYCSQNALTNSSNSFIFLKSEIIKLTNYTVSKHNILPLELWKLYYDLTLGNDEHKHDQEQINLIIQQTFKMLNKCGAAFITASTFSCFNCFFENVIGLKSSIFEIKTQGEGNVQLRNLTINSSEYDLSKIIDSSGCITIYSSNSLLNLTIINAVFVNIFQRMASSILTISPSIEKNYILIQDVTIKNCISLKNPIINILFSTQNANSNKVVIKNANINFQEDYWIKYFQKTGTLSENEILDITGTSNALIQLQNCNLVLSKIFIQGLFGCPLIKLINISYLLIYQLWATEIKTFYGLNLLELNQDLSKKSIINIKYGQFQRISIYEISNNPIYYSSKINYMIKGCFQIQNVQQRDSISSFGQILKLFQSPQKVSSIIKFQSNSNNTVFYIYNLVLLEINCSYCTNGLIFFNIENYKTLTIGDFICNSNQIQQYGCINIMAANQINRNSKIQNSNFFYNNGSSGVALYSSKIPIKIIQCNIINNFANNQGGGLFLDMDIKYLIINKSSIINNHAFEGGGIYLFENGNINSENFIQTFMQFNKADFFSNNLVEFPTHLTLFINSQEMQAEELIINNFTIRILKLKPYKIIEQGVIKSSQYLMIPSSQVIKEYMNFIPQIQIVQNVFNNLQIMLKNSRNEFLQNSHQFSCLVSQATAQLNQIYSFKDSKLISTLQTDEFNRFDLGSIQFNYDPYQDENYHLQILVNCSSNSQQSKLIYLINARTYKCQLGEFYIDQGCQICESTFGYYSVTYDSTKCSIFDKTKFANISSHAIQLLEGYWRPNLYSDQTDYCFKNIKFCKGGWNVGDELCSLGHLGGLCEECDCHNRRGEGNFFKNQQESECYNCSINTITPIIFSFIWYEYKTIKGLLFLLQQHQEALKNLIYYFRNFNLNQDIELYYLNQKKIWKVFSLKCCLSTYGYFQSYLLLISNFLFHFHLLIKLVILLNSWHPVLIAIYLKFLKLNSFMLDIATIFLILIQVAIILIGYQIYILTSKGRFQTYIISNTLLYLYVSNFSGLIKQFCQIVSSRTISNIEYIQGDLTQTFGSLNHFQWIITFAIPGLALFGFCIPFALFLFMFITKKRFHKIQFRRHICYLFEEYNEQNYFWEQIKFSKKIIIILIMTYFESNILLKASLLGLVLLQSKQL